MKKNVMRKTKFCFLVLLLCVPISTFAMDISVGGSFDLGLSVVRGGYRNNLGDIQEMFSDAGRESYAKVNYLAFAPKVDVLLEFNENFGLETGVGYRNAKSDFDFEYSDGIQYTSFIRNEVLIPVMFRGQFSYDRDSKVMFLSVGPKLGIPLDNEYFSETLRGALNGTIKFPAAPVFLDLGISIGQDYRVGNNTYFGIRANYDINLLEPFKVDDVTSSALGELRHDVLSVSVGFRHKL